MKKFKVTYYIEGQGFTDIMSEGQLNNFEERLEYGAEEQLVEVEEVK